MAQRSHIKQSGFTLVELMVTLAVVAVLISIAAPSMSDYFERKRLIDAAEEMYGYFTEARSISLTRNDQVYMRFAVQNSGENWQYAISQNSGCDLTKTDPTVAGANACVIIIDDGDGTVDNGSATIDAEDLFLYRFTDAQHPTIKLTVNTAPNFNNQIVFDPKRGTINGMTGARMVVTMTTDNKGYELRLRVSRAGRVRLCSPNGDVSSYPSDDCGTS